MLGRAKKKMMIDKENTTIVSGLGQEDRHTGAHQSD